MGAVDEERHPLCHERDEQDRHCNEPRARRPRPAAARYERPEESGNGADDPDGPAQAADVQDRRAQQQYDSCSENVPDVSRLPGLPTLLVSRS
jgi:hypothetical protein